MPNRSSLHTVSCDHIILKRQTCGTILIILRTRPAAHARQVSIGRKTYPGARQRRVLQAGSKSGWCFPQVKVLFKVTEGFKPDY